MWRATMRCARQGDGPCVMILPARLSWSCCAASRCMAWPQAASDLIEQGGPAFDTAVPILSQLLKAEIAEREVRSIAYQMKAARFPAYKDLAGFDFAASEVNEAMVRQLHRCEFIDGAHNVVPHRRPGNRQDPHRHGAWRSGGRASSQEGPVLLHSRSGQCAGTGKGPEQGGPARRAPAAPRPHHPR